MQTFPTKSRLATSLAAPLISILIVGNAWGQRPIDWCGTVLTPEQMRQEDLLSARVDSGLHPLSLSKKKVATYPWHLPVKVHIVRNSDGTGGPSLDELRDMFAFSNSLLAGTDARIRLYQYQDIHYIDDDFWADVSGKVCVGGSRHLQSCDASGDCPDGTCSPKGQVLKGIANLSGALNLYIVPDHGSLCGAGSFTTFTYQGISIDRDCMNNSTTFVHEFGHYFDLRHTHETGSGVECPDGTNCATAGDLICDTPADPGLGIIRVEGVPYSPVDGTTCTWNGFTCDGGDNQGSPCVVGADICPGGTCTGDATGPSSCDGTSYAPMVSNLMSYAPDSCQTTFTTEQRLAMFNTWFYLRYDLFNLTEYVDGTGGTFSDGSATYPFATVGAAIADATSGDHLFIKAGTYSESFVVGGPAGKRLVFRKWDEGSGSVVIGL